MPVFSFLGESNLSSLRTKVYIDGYNLYYGCLKGSEHKWLDLHTLFARHILPSSSPAKCDLLGIKYFTAAILDKAAKAPDSVSSQSRYHTALRKTHPTEIEIITGYYSMTQAKAKLVDQDDPNKWPRDCHDAIIWKLEEKQSDVSLALHAYHDAVRGDLDQVVFVTNDTDIVPALQMIRDFTSVQIGLVVPTRDHQRIPNTDLTELAHWVRTHITDIELANSQMQKVVHGGKKPTIKPQGW